MNIKFLGSAYNEHSRWGLFDSTGISPTLTAAMGMGGGYVPMILEIDNMDKINVIGKMDNTLDHTFESANRIYDSNGICPTLPTAQGGGITPKILEKEDIIVDKVNEVGFMNSGTGKHQSNTVYSEEGCSPTITTLQGGTQQIKICQKDNNSIKKVGQISNDGSQYGTVVDEKGLVSTLSAGTHGYANCCIHSKYRIRKLTPKECFRLMNFDDEDFKAAEEVNSNTQLYKQSGNSIAVSCLAAILSQLNIQGIKPWNDRTEEEQYDLVNLQQESET